MDQSHPETKDEIIHRLQKRLQAMELSYHDLLDNFDARVKLGCREQMRKTEKVMAQIKAIQKIVGDHGGAKFS